MSDDPRFFSELVGQMRAMRRLKPDPVPVEVLQKVLQAGVQAPSGMNSQPWKFLVLSSREDVAWYAERYKAAIESRFTGFFEREVEGDSGAARQLRALRWQAEHMHSFPLILLVFGERDWPFKVPPEERVGLAPPNYGAIYPCVQNILLACRAVGLGAGLTTMHQVFEDELLERFAVDEAFGIVASIPIGWPLGKFGPVRRTPATEKTFYGRWGEHAPPGDALGER